MSHDKLRYDLIHPIILEELAHVFTVGSRKYSSNGWLEHPIAHGDQVAALYRHLQAYLSGEHVAKDDGQAHLASVMWRAGTLRVYDRLGIRVGGPLPNEVRSETQETVPCIRGGSDQQHRCQ